MLRVASRSGPVQSLQDPCIDIYTYICISLSLSVYIYIYIYVYVSARKLTAGHDNKAHAIYHNKPTNNNT